MATNRQKRVVDKIVEKVRNDEPIVKGEILREAGYSEAVSIVPKKVFESKGLKELLAEVMPDDEVADLIREGMHATKTVRLGDGGEPVLEPDHQSRVKYIDMKNKIDGSYAPTKSITATLSINDLLDD